MLYVDDGSVPILIRSVNDNDQYFEIFWSRLNRIQTILIVPLCLPTYLSFNMIITILWKKQILC